MATRAGPLHGASLFAAGMSTQDVYAHKPARATPFAVVAGHTRALYEHATGQPLSDDQPACAELNSRGLLGEDHSGVGYGKELKHTFWQVGFDVVYNPVRVETSGTYEWSNYFWVPVPSGYTGSRYETATASLIYTVVTQLTTGSAYAYLSSGASGGPLGGEDSIDVDQAAGTYAGTCSVTLAPGEYNRLTLRLRADVTSGSYEAKIYGLALSQSS